MTRWLSEPVTRGEAIGWALGCPAVLCIGVMGFALVRLVGDLQTAAGTFPDSVPPLVDPFLALGTNGMTLVVAACALLPIAVQFTRQRSWVRLAAPIVCTLLVAGLLRCEVVGFREFAESVTLLHGAQAAVGLPK